MSKVAAYLQEHIQGEVSTNSAILTALGRDMGVLEIAPEMAVYPRITSDIRKVARFSWQLAEKGHVLPVTVRGNGSDQTGGAIGKGISIVTPAHMNTVFELDPKQKLVRLQPGVTTKSLSDALSLHGLGVPALTYTAPYATVGGIVASGTSGPLAGKYGTIGNWVHQLEVVLPNGDILQTERLSKRELNKRKGVQGFEGEIYRALDNLINDNQQLINEKVASDIPDNVGYSAIARVKGRDGSFDLMPLFLGSQGTLGIISEMIMKAEFISTHNGIAVATFASREAARDALDQLRQFEPTLLEYFDSSLFDVAAEHGKTYSSYKEAGFIAEAVILIGFDDFNDRVNVKKLKKIQKSLTNDNVFFVAATGDDAKELLAVREVTAYLVNPSIKGSAAPPLFNDVYVPAERFEDFLSATKTLGEKFHVTLPIHYRALEGLVSTRPTLQLHKVGDKQKIFKLLDEYAKLVADYGGHLIGNGGEGRVKANFAYKQLDDDVLELFSAIKAIFDPYGLLNSGVKQATELRHLVTQLRSDYDTAAFASFVPYN